MIFQMISKKKKKGLHSCDPRFLRYFQGYLQKKVFIPAYQVFSRIFEWSSQTNKKRDISTNRPGPRDMALKPVRMASLPTYIATITYRESVDQLM